MSISPILDLTRRHFVHSRGEVTVVGTWVHLDGDWQPCLALLRSGARDRELVPCLIPLANAHVWFEDFGDPAPAVSSCYRFLAAMGLDITKKRVRWILALVHDHLPDLLAIPPQPPLDDRRPVVAEVTVTDRASGVSREVVLRDD